MLDRIESDHVDLTQEFLAQMLGTHRPSVTLALGALERAGLVHRVARARIDIIDRPGLRDAACECYRRTTAEMSRLFD